jgi:hypothetical protein
MKSWDLHGRECHVTGAALGEKEKRLEKSSVSVKEDGWGSEFWRFNAVHTLPGRMIHVLRNILLYEIFRPSSLQIIAAAADWMLLYHPE